MHNYTTIIGVIRMRKDHISIDKVRQRYGIGSSGISLIMKRFEESGLTFKEFEALEPSKVEEIIYPKDNLRRKNFRTIKSRRDHLSQGQSQEKEDPASRFQSDL